ncbi:MULTISPECIES: 3-isopropylmalate dehydrogenase [Planococcus]|uniref:3-isopropylmalate dehydrogenase n=1 Tax=Planococcus faecalis TaxID=1598147 RepID=A0ABM6IW46_9BACL|nr:MULTISPECIES: 3-isopropylmalate dehydrogenase [Planococcus]AQU80731.1 3-isopropylmalate dehydrogenase [Planococcus faecalis]MDJ0331947.1 3-isopropylmalate dehydrogenase [Planococcus sp. S3-L1]OHX55722.1 3-isopropylmalate dehydrogenase [Planococcus faecalis]
MSGFFLILMGFFIVGANLMGFIFYKKRENLYDAAFILFLLTVLFGAIGGLIALLVIRDAFALFYGLQVGYYLLLNSVVAFLIALVVTAIQRYNHNKL